MKQPITVSVAREHANAGDVITTITDSDGETQKLSVDGQCSAFTALRCLQPFLEQLLNATPTPILDGLDEVTKDYGPKRATKRAT